MDITYVMYCSAHTSTSRRVIVQWEVVIKRETGTESRTRQLRLVDIQTHLAQRNLLDEEEYSE